MTYYSLCGSIALSNIKNAVCLNFGLGTHDQVGKQTLNIISLDVVGLHFIPIIIIFYKQKKLKLEHLIVLILIILVLLK